MAGTGGVRTECGGVGIFSETESDPSFPRAYNRPVLIRLSMTRT